MLAVKVVVLGIATVEVVAEVGVDVAVVAVDVVEGVDVAEVLEG